MDCHRSCVYNYGIMPYGGHIGCWKKLFFKICDQDGNIKNQ